MKKLLIIIIAMALPIVAMQAREKRDDSKYLASGAVPTDANGIVVWHQAFAAPGHSAAAIFEKMKSYLDGIEKAAIHDHRTNFIEANMETGVIVLRCEEWMVFKHKPLNLDRTRFRYHFQVQCADGRCDMTITQVSYYYEEDLEGNNGKTYKAEEWITDREAINKKGNKLLPYSGKFRRKTIDRVEALFDGARNAFETPQVKEEKKNTQILK